MEAGDRMLAFFAEQYPGATVTTEQSVAWRSADNQLMEVWIDLLLETPAGYVLVNQLILTTSGAGTPRSGMHISVCRIRVCPWRGKCAFLR
ncbi:hypothetical protein [Arthrobacter sp. MP_M7]|uniref:hypothetical protein n=1 Tax=Arthrobacter sp. MP_M7 TaxID=3071716 RepID=UPI002E150484